MDEACIYEGMRAVCAVLAELEPLGPQGAALRLAERHLHLLAELAEAAAKPGGAAGKPGPAQPFAGARLRVEAPEEASHVLQ